MLKYSKFFPPKHVIWETFIHNGEDFRYQKTQRRKRGGNILELKTVWLVDTYNNVYIGGWDPNNFFPNKEIEMVVTKKKKNKTEFHYLKIIQSNKEYIGKYP